MEIDPTLGETVEDIFWGAYQPALVTAITDLLRPGDTFIDVGANIGYISFVAAGCVGQLGQVHSFEPVPIYYRSLRRLRELNPTFDITVNECALGSEPGEGSIQVSSDDIGFSTMVAGAIRGRSIAATHSVRVVRLDEYARNAGLTEIRLVKIDTEGYEFEVIRGMGKILAAGARPRPAIVCEIVPRFLAAAGTSLAEFSDFMERRLYVARRVDDPGEPLRVPEVDRQCDVLFVPSEWL